MPQPWTLLASQDAFRNRWLHVTLDTVQLPDGRSYQYTSIRRHSIGVAAAVLNDANQILLEMEYRLPVDEVVYQLPGGLSDPDEDPGDCIRRELQEETGLAAGALHYLGTFWNNPALSDGRVVLFLCQDWRVAAATNHDPAEFITWDWYDLPWVRARILDGTIRDRVVICAMAFLWLAGVVS